mmetsp:Transcript_20428/g.31259  ORF Transcript_20428/g.31259 Transcript_20428/m.31259 type:complete len:132 (+) Transcript_20428:398-793(+)
MLHILPLIIYIHRHERERLISGAKEVFRGRGGRWCDVRCNGKTNTCSVKEGTLLSDVVAQDIEIGLGDVKHVRLFGETRLILYLLQRNMTKYYCSELTEIHSNEGQNQTLQTTGSNAAGCQQCKGDNGRFL